jgi:hypothetical protein
MRFVLSLAAVLALAVGLNVGTADPASAWCGWRCRGAVAAPVVVMPAPVVVVPAPAPIPIARPCGGCSGGAYYGGAAYYYVPGAYYAYYNACNAGPGNCYWRRDCWYDAFGRRFCN